MRLVLLLIAALFAAGAVAALALDLGEFQERGLHFEALGKRWFDLHPNSLQLLEPAVTRYLHPAIWESGLQPLLLAPAVLVLLGLAVFFWFVAPPYRERTDPRPGLGD